MHKLDISRSERFILLFALRRYIKWLASMETRKGYVPYAELALRKLLKNPNPEVDGGEMITFVEALRHRATEFYQIGRERDSEFHHELAKDIDLQRQLYQYSNRPKLA